jgi:type II secretory pathway component PulJ
MKTIKTKFILRSSTTENGSRRGITLVELMIVVVITMIVFLSIGSGLVAGQRCWNRAWKKVNLQRDASYAMNIMSRPIKGATSVTVAEDDDSVLTIDSLGGGRTTFSLESDTPETKKLQRQFAEANPHKIIGNVEDVVFVVDGNRVRIFIRLKQEDIEVALASTVMMRNYGL